MARLVGPVKFVMPNAVPLEAPETISALVAKLIGGGPLVPAATDTLSNVDVLSFAVSWLVTARPASAFEVIVTDAEPIWVHVAPSSDNDAMMVPAFRESLSQTGATCAADPAIAICVP